VIAIVDDGIDIEHAEFASAGKIVAPQSLTRPRGPDPRPGDGDNHGTACAGVACADGRHGASGVAPDAKLMPLRMVSGLGSMDEADAFAWAADHGADVISCSWGPRDGRWWDEHDPVHQEVTPLPDSTRLAIAYAIEHGRDGKGCVITWAAGNGNESVDNDGYAAHDRVIAVAACNDMGTRSAYSDMGKALWCAFPSSNGEPSLTPGIWTTDRTGAEGYNPGDESLGDEAGGYTNSFGGTSSACPGVAGVAALVLAVNPELTWSEVRDVLRGCCDRIDEAGGAYDADGHSRLYGFGRVNAARAVELAGAAKAAAAAA
jgi:subtilisin family serine protease